MARLDLEWNFARERRIECSRGVGGRTAMDISSRCCDEVVRVAESSGGWWAVLVAVPVGVPVSVLIGDVLADGSSWRFYLVVLADGSS